MSGVPEPAADRRIEDYALIGDCETAALVSREGSIDWWCLPRFDSGACFAALLGSPENGRWLITPDEPIRRITRRYRADTAVLETTFETEGGAVTLIDWMPIRSVQVDLARRVVGVRGRVRMRMELVIRFDYGSVVPWVTSSDSTLVAIAGPDLLQIRSDVPLHGENMHTVAEFTVETGASVDFVATWYPSHAYDAHHLDVTSSLANTAQWWQDWCAKCTYEGPAREVVMRSLITLKLLTYAPTGGIVAAATTSLPEHIGGSRNWDYRFCWLRDSTFLLYALLTAGYREEAKAWSNWLLRAAAGDPSKLQIMYGIAGERRLDERELPWLPGFLDSPPVRTGNAAYSQLQLDVYGELIDCMYQARRFGVDTSAADWALQHHVLTELETRWREPDEGIWEIRGARQHFTASKVLAWVAFDRGVKSIENHGLEGPVERWRKIRDEIRAQVLDQGYDSALGSFVQAYGMQELDASLLLLPIVGFLPVSDPRIVGTIAAIERTLMQDGFVLRYRTESGVDALPLGEGTFLACTMWLADNYALAGRHDDAEQLFNRVLAIANDVGLLAEEYDPVGGRQLGNFPQALSHLALVNTAFNLVQARGPAQSRQQS